MDNDLMDLEASSEEEERNAFGAVDKLVVNAAMVAASLIPTMIVGLIMPWKLAPLITGENPTGRKGILISPGLFFLVAIIGSVFLAGAAFTDAEPEPTTVQTEAPKKPKTFFGARDSIAVAQAVAQGDFTKALLVVAPIFLLSVFSATLSKAARPLLGEGWTLQASIRAWLYFTGVAISFVFISFAIASFFFTDTIVGATLSGDVPMLLFLIYFFTSIFWKGLGTSILKASAATGICLVSFVVLLVSILSAIRG